MHTYIHTYIHTCIHAYMHTCIHAYMHTCIHAYMHAYIHTYIQTYKQHICSMHTFITYTYMHLQFSVETDREAEKYAHVGFCMRISGSCTRTDIYAPEANQYVCMCKQSWQYLKQRESKTETGRESCVDRYMHTRIPRTHVCTLPRVYPIWSETTTIYARSPLLLRIARSSREKRVELTAQETTSTGPDNEASSTSSLQVTALLRSSFCKDALLVVALLLKLFGLEWL